MRSKPEFVRYLIKRYRYWELFLHHQQYPYVGRCYAWWKDRHQGEGERLPPWRLPSRAFDELNYTIAQHVALAHGKLGYRPSIYGDEYRLNICLHANEPVHNYHLHYHFIPRTLRPIQIPVLGVRCIDPQNDKNYKTSFEETAELGRQRRFFEKEENKLKIRDIMAEAFA